ncbi:MAG TPA: hypothetical protein VI485_19400 [Vicinamibacterales bacterium]|nr:hypothetical protein [Vicinamibacterales bacterium]
MPLPFTALRSASSAATSRKADDAPYKHAHGSHGRHGTERMAFDLRHRGLDTIFASTAPPGDRTSPLFNLLLELLNA